MVKINISTFEPSTGVKETSLNSEILSTVLEEDTIKPINLKEELRNSLNRSKPPLAGDNFYIFVRIVSIDNITPTGVIFGTHVDKVRNPLIDEEKH